MSNNSTTEQLKKVVVEKLSKCEYDREATRALLRQYQTADINAFDWNLVTNALLLARANQQVQDNDFSLLCCLVGDQFHSSNEMRWLLAVDDLLATGKFDKLWGQLADLTGVSDSLKEFYAKNKAKLDACFLRSVLVATSLACAEVDASALCAFANVKSASELSALPAAKGVIEKVDGKVVKFVKNDANTPPPAAAPRTLNTADVAALAKTIP